MRHACPHPKKTGGRKAKGPKKKKQSLINQERKPTATREHEKELDNNHKNPDRFSGEEGGVGKQEAFVNKRSRPQKKPGPAGP